MGYLVLPAALLSLCKCVCLFVTTSLHPDLQCHAMPDIVYITLPNRENVGLLGSTRIGSRRVIQISAGFMIFFSILGEILLSVQSKNDTEPNFLWFSTHFVVSGKFGALFASIPFTLFAAIYCVLFGYVGM